MPSLMQMCFGRLQLHTYGLIYSLCVSELLIVHPQGASKSHLQIFVTWASIIKNVAIYYRFIKRCIVELAAGKHRAVKIGTNEPTSSEVARIENAIPHVARVEDRILEIHCREALCFSQEPN